MLEYKTTNDTTIVFVEVPKDSSSNMNVENKKDATDEAWFNTPLCARANYLIIEGDDGYGIKLPQGNYTFLCTTDAITEELAAQISIEFVQNLDPNKTYAILQKK